MKTLVKGIAIASLASTAGFAQAELSMTVGMVSDYVYRGVELGDAGAYTSIDYATGGFYAGVWAISDGNTADGIEYDIYAGYETEIAGVGVGEETGHLDKILLRLSDELSTSAENRKTVTRALIYPVTLISVSIAMVALMMVLVVPKITSVFASSNRELPWITELIIGVSNFVQDFILKNKMMNNHCKYM